MNNIKKIVRKIIPSQHDVLRGLLKQELKSCEKILDLGCGENSPLYLLKGDPDYTKKRTVGVDIFYPYILDNVQKKKIHSEYVNQNIFEINFPEDSFDCAVLLDVIEHFEKDDFLEFLPRLEKMVKKIIVLTPNGFVEQHAYNGNPYQEHLSGWTMEDLRELGFQKFYGMSGVKGLFQSKIKPEIIRTLLINLSQPLILNRPQYAFHLFAVKENNKK